MKKIFKISEIQELISSTNENFNKRAGETSICDLRYVYAESETDAISMSIANFLTDINPLRIEERTENSVTITRNKMVRDSVFERNRYEVTVKATFNVEGEI